MRHADSEVRDASVCLLGHTQIALGYEDVAHGEHAEATQLLGTEEHHGREPAWHLGV